jgi:hypothetical protein
VGTYDLVSMLKVTRSVLNVAHPIGCEGTSAYSKLKVRLEINTEMEMLAKGF